MKLLEQVFHVALFLSAFIAYFTGHLHWAFWLAIAWACYLMVAFVLAAKVLEQLPEIEKSLDDLKRKSGAF